MLGVGYVLGRDLRKAETVAVLDALLQQEAWHERVMRDVVIPETGRQAKVRSERSQKVAATRVNFFTMVRGNDVSTLVHTLAPSAGFAEPVAGAQSSFRALLSALSAPGTTRTVTAAHEAPAPFGPALGAACLTLLDYDTPVWLDPILDGTAIAWLRFHTGAPIVYEPDAAAFAIILAPQDLPPIGRFCLGSDEAPESGTTLLVQVPDFREGRGLHWSGPGIAHRRTVSIDGLASSFWTGRHALSELGPRGVDAFFFAGDRVIGLPRTTRVDV